RQPVVRHRHRAAGRGAGLRLPPAARLQPAARSGAHPAAPRGLASRGRSPFSSRHGECHFSRRKRRHCRNRRPRLPARTPGDTMNRIDNARTVRAPRGTELTARSWLTEAPLRMLMNNVDPDVAEKPGELVVYGGIGRAARDWESFDRIVASL